MFVNALLICFVDFADPSAFFPVKIPMIVVQNAGMAPAKMINQDGIVSPICERATMNPPIAAITAAMVVRTSLRFFIVVIFYL